MNKKETIECIEKYLAKNRFKEVMRLADELEEERHRLCFWRWLAIGLGLCTVVLTISILTRSVCA